MKFKEKITLSFSLKCAFEDISYCRPRLNMNVDVQLKILLLQSIVSIIH